MMRICSLLPSATEILYALGLDEEIVGVSHECDYPAKALQKPKVIRTIIDYHLLSSAEIDAAVHDSLRKRESLYQVDMEALRDARPDLIVTQELCEVCAIDTAHISEALGVLSRRPKLISLHSHTVSQMLDEIRLVGGVTGREQQADMLVDELQQRIARVRERVHGQSRPRIFCLEWLKPPMASGHWVPGMVEISGGEDVLGIAGEPSRYVSWEEIVAAAPELVVIMVCGFSIERTRRELSLIESEPSWRKLPAVLDHRVFLVNGPAYFNRPGPRLVDGIELLAGVFHPDTCEDFIPPGAVEPLSL